MTSETSYKQHGSASPRFSQSTPLKKFSCIPLIILLYTAATPFSPVVWVTTSTEGSYLLDYLFSGVLLFGALFFQYCITKQEFPVVISFSTGNRRTRIENGNIVEGGTGSDIAWLYDPRNYWMYVGGEAGLLAVAEWGGHEIARRLVVSSVIAGLWAVGWFVTPQSTKREAWNYVKQIWFWLVLDHIRQVGFGGARRSRGRAF